MALISGKPTRARRQHGNSTRDRHGNHGRQGRRSRQAPPPAGPPEAPGRSAPTSSSPVANPKPPGIFTATISNEL